MLNMELVDDRNENMEDIREMIEMLREMWKRGLPVIEDDIIRPYVEKVYSRGRVMGIGEHMGSMKNHA